MKNLRDSLKEIVEGWDSIVIRVNQDGRWQSLFLSEIKNETIILDWIINLRNIQRAG